MKRIDILFLSLFIFLPATALSQTGYVRSGKCQPCHKKIYENWVQTLHSRSQQVLSATNDSVVVEWKGTIKLKAGKIPEVTVKLSDTADGAHQITLVDAKNPSEETIYTVVRTYGGWGWKQRYQVKIGNNHYVLPIQWNQSTSRWVPYNLQNWYNEEGSLQWPSIDKSFEMSCAGCHNTGLQLKRVDKGYESSYVELNTGCEKCHGPGAAHIKSPKAKGGIINPRKLAYERGLEACGQCHSRGVSAPNGTFGFPWNDKENKGYPLGEPLKNYYQLKPGLWEGPLSEAHSLSHHQQWHDLLKSGHFSAKITCYDCHDPHGGPGRFQLVKSDFNNQLCLSCHGKSKKFSHPEAIRAHTRHHYAPETVGTSRCSSCHMVKTAASAEAGDIHSHDFKIIPPQASLDMFRKDPNRVIPNSCNQCHKEWSKDEAGYQAGVKGYESLFGK